MPSWRAARRCERRRSRSTGCSATSYRPRTGLASSCFDACRSNPFARSFAARTRSATTAGLAEIGASSGAYVAFATAPGDVAADGVGGNSPFTAALLRHITTPGLEIDGLMKRVRREVYEATRQDQLPWTNSALLGEFFFVPPTEGTSPQPQAALPPAEPSGVIPTPGGRDDPDERWYKKAAEQGDATGQRYLGLMYERGDGGLAKDEVEAVRWYRKAAEQGGTPWAQANLGLMYELGRRRPGEGRGRGGALVQKRRRAGRTPWAQANLGGMYERGAGGLAKDEAEAVRWSWQETG